MELIYEKYLGTKTSQIPALLPRCFSTQQTSCNLPSGGSLSFPNKVYFAISQTVTNPVKKKENESMKNLQMAD